MNIPDSKSRPDRELWMDLRKGNKSALRILFLRHYDSLYQYGVAICSEKPVIEDCLQDLFFQLWQTHQQLSEVDKVKGYLWISFRRRLMKQLKKNRDVANESVVLPAMLSTETNVENILIQREQQRNTHQVLDKLVATLSHREREVLYLKFYEGMSYIEIEKVLDVRYQTARNYVYRAINRLRDLLDKEPVKIVLAIMLMLNT